MAKTREIKGRIKAVGNIERITKTMQMIATAKFQAALRRASATKPYTEKIGDLVAQLAAKMSGGEDDASGYTHPLMKTPEPKTGKQILLVITSNRGLCGGYNGNVLRTAAKMLREETGTDWQIEVVGKKGTGYFKFVGLPVAEAHTHISDKPAYEDVEKLASSYMQQLTDGKIDGVHVCYMQYVTNAKQVPTLTKLLPIEQVVADASEEATESAGDGVKYDFMPSAEDLLNNLIPITVKTQLFQCFTDAVVSEQIARMIAMKAATDNASQMKKLLKRQFNRARQTQITTELTEIISGAAALE